MERIAVNVKVLRKGDTVLQIEQERIVIRRKSGEVDVLVLSPDERGAVRIDYARSFRIGFGEGEIEAAREVDGDDVELITF